MSNTLGTNVERFFGCQEFVVCPTLRFQRGRIWLLGTTFWRPVGRSRLLFVGKSVSAYIHRCCVQAQVQRVSGFGSVVKRQAAKCDAIKVWSTVLRLIQLWGLVRRT